MFKKLTVLAMALGAVAALALPAVASAEWTDNTQPVTQPQTIGFTGTNVRFQGGLGGVECQTTSRVTFTPGSTGHAETFVPHPTDETTNCKGIGGLAPCQIHNLNPQNLPWTVHTNTSDITVTTGTITSQSTGGFFCLVKHIELTPGTVTGTVDNPHAVSTVQLGGQLTSHIQTNNGTKHQEPVQVGGVLHVEDPNAGTYGIT